MTTSVAQPNVIILEFNELVPDLLDRFIAEGRLPNFKRLRDEAIVAITDAEEEPPHLEPWIQWVSVHSGVPYAEHKCFNLNDGARFKAPRIWDVVSDAGRRVWICGSMNAGVSGETINGHVLPDPWATGVKSLPEGFFDDFNRLVRAYVHEHSGKPDISPADTLKFARFMIANGLSAKTIWSALRQLASERRDNTKWRRPVILDRLAWDLFRAIWKNERPALATFFLNSTAHFQHFHWREFEPEQFEVKASAEDQRTYGETVAFGYQQMDEIVGEVIDMAGPETSIVLLTALSQKPMLHFEELGGRQIFRHKDHADLMRWAGVTERYAYEPIMSQQFMMTFDSDEDAAAAAVKIERLRMADGAQVMLARRDGHQIVSGCLIDIPPAADALVTSGASNQARRFWDLFYPLEALRSGMHHPDGVFWARTPSRRHMVLDRKLSLLELAPTLVEMAGVSGASSFRSQPIAEVIAAMEPLPALKRAG